MRIFPVLVGQGMAVMTTCTAIFTKLIISTGIVAPAFQLLWMYIMLSLVYSTVLMFRTRKLSPNEWGKYSAVSITDSQANFLLVSGYHLTGIVSVLTLFNSSVILVMVLSIFLLHKKYNRFQYTGTATAFIGISLIVLSHLHQAAWKWGGNLMGDTVVLGGTVFYCITNIMQEYLMIRGSDPSQYLFILGSCGALIMTAEAYRLEYDMIVKITTLNQILYIGGFATCLFVNYSITPYFFRRYGATFYNLSLLSSSLYGMIFELAVYGTSFELLYLLGFSCVMVGIIIYNLPPQKTHEPQDLLQEHDITQEIQLPEKHINILETTVQDNQ